MAVSRLRVSRGGDYALSVIVLAVTAGLGYAASRSIPVRQLNQRDVTNTTSRDTSASPILALGEEIFSRGLITGLLIRRLGFWRGNTLQAAAEPDRVSRLAVGQAQRPAARGG